MEIFRSNLETILSKVVYWSLLEQGGWASLVGSSLVLPILPILRFYELSEAPFSKYSVLKWLDIILHNNNSWRLTPLVCLSGGEMHDSSEIFSE